MLTLTEPEVEPTTEQHQQAVQVMSALIHGWLRRRGVMVGGSYA